MVGQVFYRRCKIGSTPALCAQFIVCMMAFSLAFGAAEARAAQTTPVPAHQTLSNSGHPIQDLGDVPPPPDEDTPTPTSASTSAASNAQAVPELPMWAMLLVFFAGLGLARLKRGRKDRLSPGLE
jgi:hypothetical protein